MSSVNDRLRINRLVALAAEGDLDAQQELLSDVRPMVVRYCRARLAMNDAAYGSADDVAQEVCISVLTSLSSYRDMGRPFIAFVYGIAAHKVADAYRRSMRFPTDAVESLPELPDTAGTPEDAAMATETGRQLAGLLEQLPAGQREVLTLRVGVGLSAEETAEVLDMTPGAVRVAQHRGLNKLRRRLSSSATSAGLAAAE